MYSLDQVIYFLEQRQQTEDWNIRDEAITYLKGYREVLPEYAQMKLDAVKNDPLTFSEVYDMDDKPVWMEWSDVKGWRLVRSYTSALGVKTVVLTDRYGVDFVFSEDTFERCEVMVYPKEHHELRY